MLGNPMSALIAFACTFVALVVLYLVIPKMIGY